MTRRSDGRPRHEQIAADLRARIMAGDLPSGAQLPSIPTLVTQYGAATATIQRALAALKDEGYLHSHVGKGVYVRDREPLVVTATAYVPPSEGRFAYEILEVTEIEPPAEVSHSLGLASGEPALLRHRLLRYRSEPVELSWSYYPAAIVRHTELARPQRIRGGAPRVLAEIGHPQQRHVDRVSARMPTTEELERLDLPANVPVLRQFRVVHSPDRPVEATVMVKGAHLHELRYDREADGVDGR
ncbi:GntR family transcriptional regulator [Micromonospora carbonacea]|nr:GntR family transcriptional regulator [Micromonospora carbonacea]